MDNKDRKSTSFRLSAHADRLLDALGERLGIDRSAALELSIRYFARHEGVDEGAPPPPPLRQQGKK
ncbi:MAG: hypothetical protein HYS12_22150 [Planctomycetes bacterium]|nr:hypothetical protein [Planctomycetota bacterium]